MSSSAHYSPNGLTRMARRVQPIGVSVFSEMSRLAQEHNAVNLSQGFPDFPAPDWLKDAAQEAIERDVNQYAPSQGSARLRKAIAAKVEERMGTGYDENLEITVTSGATEAVYDAIQALVNPGDEVIVFEPFYDSYVPAIELAGGVPSFLTLHAPHWSFDFGDLIASFNDRTRAILINTPHNPTGKVFGMEELELIADLCKKHDVLAITDEVYEYLVYDDNRHISIASLPGMRNRTVTINSASKTFSVTGWKIGYMLAAPDLTEAVRRLHQFVVFCSAAPFQEAVAIGMERAGSSSYYRDLQAGYVTRRDMLLEALQRAELKPIRPQGAFFVMSDISGLGFKDDVEFARYMTTEVGVACIPPSAFYHNPAGGANLARWCFAKRHETLNAAGERLEGWSSSKLLTNR
ncbi:MAG: aminotransferase class I/II-fold pyridoxal phosphate-dependent enzyme [Chloroflexi bacterium]|nr:aminotransferase class I/II-fold pyridoxal phosphate-dependent enzyme [Chloroflexota bacterium]